MEDQKPFVCKADGCNMSFTNEDHLNVHTKKHAMVLHLSLGNKAASFAADQTPTPTRLIRNCDEVGLFEDLHLQHVNPFEETFRRAVESKSTATTPNLETTNLLLNECLTGDETLHTPRVLPYYDITDTAENDKPPVRKKLKLNTKIIKKSNEESSAAISDKININQNQSPRSENKEIITTPKIERILPALNKIQHKKIQPQIVTVPQLVQIQLISSATLINNSYEGAPRLLPKVNIQQSNAMQTVRQRLKTAALLKNSIKLVNESPTATKSIPEILLKLKTDSKQLTVNGTKPEKSKSKPNDVSERNRAAALRYRNKMKSWYNEIKQKNLELETENESLKAELSQLKAFLLAHQDCSVSKAMALGHNIPIGLPQLIIKDTPSQCTSIDDDPQTKPVYFIINKKDFGTPVGIR